VGRTARHGPAGVTHRRPRGVVALEDLLEQVIGPFEDETDHLGR
jgi:hypothetical protein